MNKKKSALVIFSYLLFGLIINVLFLSCASVYAAYDLKITAFVNTTSNNYSSDIHLRADSSSNDCLDIYDMVAPDLPSGGIKFYSDLGVLYDSSGSGLSLCSNREQLSIDSWNDEEGTRGDSNPYPFYFRVDTSDIQTSGACLNLLFNPTDSTYVPELYYCSDASCTSETRLNEKICGSGDSFSIRSLSTLGSYSSLSSDFNAKNVCDDAGDPGGTVMTQISGAVSCCPTDAGASLCGVGTNGVECCSSEHDCYISSYNNNLWTPSSGTKGECCHSSGSYPTEELCGGTVCCPIGTCNNDNTGCDETKLKSKITLKLILTTPSSASAASASSSSSGGGSVSSLSSFYWIKTTDLGSLELNSDSSLADSGSYLGTLSSKERVEFIIDGEEHNLGIVSVSDDSAIIQIASSPINVKFKVGEEKKFDLNNDLYYDLFVRLNNVIDKKASIFMKAIHDQIAVPSNSSSKTIPKIGDIKSNDINLPLTNLSLPVVWVIFIVIIVAVLIIIIVFLMVNIARKSSKKR